MKKFSIILVLLLILSILFVSTGEIFAGEYRDEIRVALDVDAGTMDPRLSQDTAARRVIELVYDGLVRLNTNLEPTPALAESWENPDDVTWIFHLREDVVFHDGSALTAEDVKFTFSSILNPDMNAPYRSLYEPIKNIEIVDQYTIKFELEEPYAPMLAYMDLGIVPKDAGEEMASAPIGTGPYQMDNWSRNDSIQFSANNDYWNGSPQTENVIYYIIPDNTTRASALEAGDIDLIHSPLSPLDINRLRGYDQFVVNETTGLGFTYLNFNWESDLISELEVRKAIAHSVDKEAIAEGIYDGMDSPGVSPLIPPFWAYDEDLTGYPFDLDEARKILDEAGWSDVDGDGTRIRDGERLEITLSTHSEDPNRIQAVEYLQQFLSLIGIDASIEINEWPTFQSDLIEGNHDVALLGWLNLVEPDRAMYNQFHSEGGSNYGNINLPELDELLEKGRTTLEQEERTRIYQEAAQIVVDKLAYDVILYQGYYAIYPDTLENFEIHPAQDLKTLYKVTIRE